jgi:DNA-binding GntR family transcriptional regulator
MNDDNAFEGIMLPRSLMEDITDSLKDAIIEGRLQPGQQIVEKELQKTLGVSRAPIREALLKLEGQGLVVIVPRKGSFVRNITARFIQESFTIRAWLEGLAARISIEHLDKSDYDHFDKILKDMEQLAKKRDFKGYFYRHWDFHNVFIRGSQNELLIEKVEALRRQSLWLSYSITYFEKKHKMSQAIHAEIIDVFKKGDPDEVEREVRHHILKATEDYVKYLNETYPNKSRPRIAQLH